MPHCDIEQMFKRARHVNRRLYHWMVAHHDRLVEELGPGRIEWAPVMLVVEELGLVDKTGKTPTQDTVFRTWKRVRRDIAARKEKPAKGEPSLSQYEIAPGVQDLEGQQAADIAVGVHASSPSRSILEIKPARSLDQLPSSVSRAGATARSRDESDGSGNSADQLERVLDAIGSTRTPLPKTIR